MLTRRAEIETWISWLRAQPELTPEDLDPLMAQLGEPGLGNFLRLMLASQQDWQRLLAQLPLHSSANIAQASIIQGQIKAIDMLLESMVELGQAAQADT